MVILLTDVAPAGPNCQAALSTLDLPRLSALLCLLHAGERIDGEASTLTPLSERLRAQELGISCADGLVPWAALDAQAGGLPAAAPDQGWAWITPCHWSVRSDHVAMADPAALALSAEESCALRDAMHPYFAEDGLALHPCHSGTWLALGAALHQLPTASLARVSDRAVDPWMSRLPQARKLRRLQNEMQMLLYTHPVNTAREARRQPIVNSFWISGTGALPANVSPPTPSPQALAVETLNLNARLRAAGARDDAAEWIATWRAMDEQIFAPVLEQTRSGAALTLTLCGHNTALRLQNLQGSAWQRLRARWRTIRAADILATL